MIELKKDKNQIIIIDDLSSFTVYESHFKIKSRIFHF